jgi:hypothetical protein
MHNPLAAHDLLEPSDCDPLAPFDLAPQFDEIGRHLVGCCDPWPR